MLLKSSSQPSLCSITLPTAPSACLEVPKPVIFVCKNGDSLYWARMDLTVLGTRLLCLSLGLTVERQKKQAKNICVHHVYGGFRSHFDLKALAPIPGFL